MAAEGVRAYVGLGSNLEDPAAQLAIAQAAIERAIWCSCMQVSPTYRSPALSGSGVPNGQPDYLNAVVSFETSWEPAALLKELLDLEEAQGRERGQRWAARTMDLDLLLYGSRIVAAPGLIVPHPRIEERAFVLRPLADLDPGLVVPGLGSVTDLLKEVDTTPLERVD
jgi:2-amino-4-hydroxy-6-hydroxymethyldihydropteridine diphosphokinase